MNWHKSTKARPLRRRQKKFLLWISLLVSLLFVLALDAIGSLSIDDTLHVMTKVANSVLSDDEKKTVWNGMSEEGKAVIRRHMPTAPE